MPKIGFHGTKSAHRKRYLEGDYVREGTFGKGELGEGLYITEHIQTALLYAYNSANGASGMEADLWEVNCSKPLDTLKSKEVGENETWDKYKDSYTKEYHYIIHGPKDSRQTKFNFWAAKDLITLKLLKSFSVADADKFSDNKQTSVDALLKIIGSPKAPE